MENNKKNYHAWQRQQSAARGRNIPWNFPYPDWLGWWQRELAARPGARRGPHRDEYQMCRFGDSGGYEPGNVFCGTPRDNYRDRLHHRNLDALAKANAAGGCFKGRRGDQHPASCAVMTSLGRFGSIALAADAYGMTRQRGRYRVVRGDWYMVPREA